MGPSQSGDSSDRSELDWLWWAVDLLASEYGWSKREILEDVYVDELVDLVVWINRRKLQETKMQMSIIQNPHVKDPSQLWKNIEAQERALSSVPDKMPEFDEAGFELLKTQLSNNPNFIVK